MKLFVSFLTVFLLCSSALGVKDYLFKNCDNSGFCKRNRVFANNVRNNSNFESKYWIDPSSINLSQNSPDFIVRGSILKKLPKYEEYVVKFPFELSLLEGNNLRIKVDEARSIKSDLVNPRRYHEASAWSFKSTSDLPYLNSSAVDFQQTDENLVIYYGDKKQYKAEILFHPFKLFIYYNNELQIIVNDQNFLNIEHYRTKPENNKHLSNEEIDFNMFEDDFKDSKSDKVPLGPESIGLDFTFKNFNHLFGIPEHADDLNLKETMNSNYPYRLFNVDIFEYEIDSRLPMYGSIPLLMAAKPGVSVGLFWISSADTFIDIDKSSSTSDSRTHWMSENGIIDMMIIIGELPQDINRSYGLITGYSQLPQLFSLGYHQCRWNYNDEKDVLEINSLMDKYQIPYDTIWLDIEYTDSKKYFTWQPDKFPNPKRMLDELDHTSRNLVIIIDPHFKNNYFVSDDLKRKGLTINDSNNNHYYGHCWPGESIWVDTLNPKSQEYWDSKFVFSEKNEFLGRLSTNIHIWNDMNEPSVFNGPESSTPRDNLHYGNWEHRSVHNLYGLSFHETTYNSMIKRLQSTNRQRPFVLTRSYFAGSQRTAAMWTGDNMSKWEYLKISVPMLLTSNIVNMPFGGADVGGFFGDPSKELLTRWYQTGIWYPFFRAHAHIDSRRREPWIAGDPYTSIMRDAIKLRYSLLPVFYTSFYESSVNGSPILKPLFYETPNNLETYLIDDQFFLGNSGLLVKPITEENANSVKIYLPDNEIYYDFTSGIISNQIFKFDQPTYITKSITLNDIPTLIKGGSIIAKKDRYRRSSKLMANDPYTLIIGLDKNGIANGSLYIDDGESFNYLNNEFINVQFEATKDKISGDVIAYNNDYSNSLDNILIEKVILLSVNNIKSIKISQNSNNWDGKFEILKNNLIIKRPNIKINSNWAIELDNNAEFIHDEL